MPKAKVTENSPIIIDEAKGLVFQNEEDLYKHFSQDIEKIESLFTGWRRSLDIPEEDFDQYDNLLEATLEAPDEIWQQTDGEMIDSPLSIYVKVFDEGDPDSEFINEADILYYVAVCYTAENLASFIYLHFPSKDLDLVEKFREGQLKYSKALEGVPEGALEGDALFEADELAMGLYDAMIKLRSASDIPESDFVNFADYRELTVEGADEIWRKDDMMGNVLVTFVRQIDDHPEETNLYYIVVTLEDTPSNSHSLLFSFPTKDPSLVERYRQGENLQAEEVIHESSH